MSFGFGVGDFIPVCNLALELYNACAGAPGEFQELQRDLSSVHTVLYDLQSQAEDPNSLLNRPRDDDVKPGWKKLEENLNETFLELQDLLKRYENMGGWESWRRVPLGLEDLNNLKGKLSVHLNLINAFVSRLTLSTLGRMEPTLGRIEHLLLKFMKEDRLKNRASTVVSAHEGSRQAWKQMKLDLLLGGISREDLERNEKRIKELLDWVVNNEKDLQEIEVEKSISPRQSFEEELVIPKPESRDVNESSTLERLCYPQSAHPPVESKDTPPSGSQRDAGWNGAQILGERFHDPSVQPFLSRAHQIADPERRIIRDILDANPNARSDSVHLNHQRMTGSPSLSSSIPSSSAQQTVLPDNIANHASESGVATSNPEDSSLQSSSTSNILLSIPRLDAIDARLRQFRYDYTKDRDGVVKVISSLNRHYLSDIERSVSGEGEDPVLMILDVTGILDKSKFNNNVDDMRWTLMLADLVDTRCTSLMQRDMSFERFRWHLSELMDKYEAGKLRLQEWTLPLPPGLKMRIMSAQQAQPPVKKVEIPIKILIIDPNITHFGFMFERHLKRIGSDAEFPAWEVDWKPLFQIHHYAGRPISGGSTAEQKRIQKVKSLLEENYTGGPEYPEMYQIENYSYPNEAYLKFFEYDFVLLVPPYSGRYHDDDRINTPFGAPFGAPSEEPVAQEMDYSVLKRSGIAFDVLDLSDPMRPEEVLELPYSRIPWKNGRLDGAKHQVERCIIRFLREKMLSKSNFA